MALTQRGSKAKGSRFELELARYVSATLADLGVEAQRALLSGGGRNVGGTDVEGVPGLHIEAKRVERLPFREAMRQAEKAVEKKTKKREVPVVITRKNHEATGDSIVMLRLDDFMVMYRTWLEKEGAEMK